MAWFNSAFSSEGAILTAGLKDPDSLRTSTSDISRKTTPECGPKIRSAKPLPKPTKHPQRLSLTMSNSQPCPPEIQEMGAQVQRIVEDLRICSDQASRIGLRDFPRLEYDKKTESFWRLRYNIKPFHDHVGVLLDRYTAITLRMGQWAPPNKYYVRTLANGIMQNCTNQQAMVNAWFDSLTPAQKEYQKTQMNPHHARARDELARDRAEGLIPQQAKRVVDGIRTWNGQWNPNVRPWSQTCEMYLQLKSQREEWARQIESADEQMESLLNDQTTELERWAIERARVTVKGFLAVLEQIKDRTDEWWINLSDAQRAGLAVRWARMYGDAAESDRRSAAQAVWQMQHDRRRRQ